ncbi:hypothetical protein [Porphyromonas levii]|uniref:hypothetical protein n=1 Tax=Porphyromonas levii TaxID=28114 RepID=UPI001BAA4905|nr:hypothetical protein [Porphyromonas levii]MBR8801760.1 hypothetical protein [Porphyromonas levii]
MKLVDIKDRIDNFFDEISAEELFDLLTEKYDFPIEYVEKGVFDVIKKIPSTNASIVNSCNESSSFYLNSLTDDNRNLIPFAA